MTHAASTRLPDAAARLRALLLARLAVPFTWGVSDCAMLAFDAALAVTGRDPAADLRGTYTNALGALRILRRLGGMHGVANTRFGPRVDWADGQDGDPVLLRAGVCTGLGAGHGALGIRWQGSVVAQGADGLVTVPMTSGRGVWRAA